MNWATAINRLTDFAARLVVVDRHEHGYDNDLLMPAPNLLLKGEIDRLCQEADLIRIKDEHGFCTGANGLPGELTRAQKDEFLGIAGPTLERFGYV